VHKNGGKVVWGTGLIMMLGAFCGARLGARLVLTRGQKPAKHKEQQATEVGGEVKDLGMRRRFSEVVATEGDCWARSAGRDWAHAWC
jgi:hypothetical protein